MTPGHVDASPISKARGRYRLDICRPRASQTQPTHALGRTCHVQVYRSFLVTVEEGSGNVTVIEARVHRSSERNARLAFFVTLFTVGLLAATVAASYIHPILAIFVGAAIGAVTAGIVWALVRVWPVLRLLWWWTPEISLALTVIYGFTALAHHTTTLMRPLVVVLVVGVPAALPWTRATSSPWRGA